MKGTGVVKAAEKEALERYHSVPLPERSLCKVRVGVFSLVTSSTANFTSRGFGWALGKIFSGERVVKHWKRLPFEMVESPSLEVFESYVDAAQKDKVLWFTQQCWVKGWQYFPTKMSLWFSLLSFM